VSTTWFLRCPECPLDLEISPEDENAAYSEILDHIQWTHPNVDRRPSVLWPRIEMVQQ
jgi:hypothetical protein